MGRQKSNQAFGEERFLQWATRLWQKILPVGLQNLLCNEMYENLPDTMWVRGGLDSIPTFWVYFIGIGTPLLTSLFFILMSYYTYQGNRHSSYISLENTADCVEVATPATGTFMASIGNTGNDGYWASSPSFNYNSSAYRLSMASFTGGSEGYDSNMIAASSRMASIGDKMATRDFSWNLIVWSSFGYSITDDNGFFSFVSTGDVRKIFDRLNVIGGFASGNGLCRTPSVIKYDPYSATFDVTLTDYGDGSERSAADPCAASLNPVGFGYDGQYDGDNVAFQLDMRSFTTAVAVNNGIIGLSDLNGVMTTTSVVAVPRADGSILSGTRRGYFVSYYSGMELIFCIEWDAASLGAYDGLGPGVSCLVGIGSSSYAYPLMNSYGTHWDTSMTDYYNAQTINFTSSYCGCDNPYVSSHGDACDKLDLMPAWIFFKDDPLKLIIFAFDAYIKSITHVDADIYMSKLAFPAIALSIYDLQSNLTQFNGAHYSSAFGDFCDNCSIFALNSYDDRGDKSVNNLYLQVSSGHCENTLHSSSSSMDMLRASPPVQFIETYFQCRMTVWDSLFSAVGLSIENTEMALFFILLVCIGLIVMFIRKFRGFDDGICEIVDDEEDERKDGEKTKKIESLIEILSAMNDCLRTGDALQRHLNQHLNQIAEFEAADTSCRMNDRDHDESLSIKSTCTTAVITGPDAANEVLHIAPKQEDIADCLSQDIAAEGVVDAASGSVALDHEALDDLTSRIESFVNEVKNISATMKILVLVIREQAVKSERVDGLVVQFQDRKESLKLAHRNSVVINNSKGTGMVLN